ncbi:MAG: zinc ribbon domain-containing protein [Planctomycetota bacterium]
MKCPKCSYENPDGTAMCGLCGELLRAGAPATQAVIPEMSPERPGLFQRPYVCLAIGLAAFPVAKLLWFPNYIFNFLATLVHEIGHSACAWFVGMPSIPAVSIGGGGVATWQDQNWQIAVLVWIGLGVLAWKARRAPKGISIPLVVLAVAYPAIAFTKLHLALAIFGGVLFEVVGSAACFVACLGARLERPFERPLYALWGWWMLLNRICESWLILTDWRYRLEHRVIESGLAEGIPSDLTAVTLHLNISPRPVLYVILALCLLALPISLGIARWMRGRN